MKRATVAHKILQCGLLSRFANLKKVDCFYLSLSKYEREKLKSVWKSAKKKNASLNSQGYIMPVLPFQTDTGILPKQTAVGMFKKMK
jgi:hypothetical protein